MTDADGVREGRPTDIPAVAALLGELGYPVEPQRLLPRFERLVGRPDHHVLVAHGSDDADVLGVLSLHFFPVLHHDHDTAVITALVVTARARGGGVGRALVERAEAIAREYGSERLMVNTHLRRAGAHTFYERLGFDFNGRRYVKLLD